MTTPDTLPAVTPAAEAPVAAAVGTALTAAPPMAPVAGAPTPSVDAVAAGAQEPAVTPYELKLPDGFEAGPEIEAFKAEAQKHKVAPEAAHAFLSMHAKVMAAQAEAKEAEIAGWAKALSTDKEIGGAQYEANKQIAFKAATRFAGDPETVAFLEKSGLGNHPLIARIFHRIGKAMAEDSVAGLSGGAPQAKPADPLRERYPSMFKES